MRSVLTTHPLGWALPITVGNTFMRSQVYRTQDQVFDVGESCQAEAAETQGQIIFTGS